MTDETVEDFVKAQEEEKERRQNAAWGIARMLSDLMLGERLNIPDAEGVDCQVMAVPGGWIFWRDRKAGTTGVFVPQPPPVPTKIEQQPGIVLPK